MQGLTNECPLDELIALARGELDEARAAEVAAHAAGCEACGAELEWLRAERRLLRERAASPAAPPPHVWQGIERRLAVAGESRAHRARTRTVRLAWAGAALAAAGVLAALALEGPSGDVAVATVDAGGVAVKPSEPPAPTPATRDAGAEALDRAEAEYEAAAEKLEAEWSARRAELDPARAERYDSEFADLRRVIDDTRAAAGEDVKGRQRVLHAYSMYVRSMKTVVLKEEMP